MSGLWDSVVSWASDHSDELIKGAATVGLGAWGITSAQDAAKQDRDARQAAIDRQFAQDQTAYQQSLIPTDSGGGGGGGGPAGPSQTQLRASRDAILKGIHNAQGLYNPYVESGKRILPQMENLYSQSLKGQGDVLNMLQTPEARARLQLSKPAYEVQLPYKQPGFY